MISFLTIFSNSIWGERIVMFRGLVCYILLSISAMLGASELDWSTDFPAAKDLAKKENKPIFLYFTGSDWCGWCMKLDKEILKNPDFIKKAGNEFIYVEIDFPLYKELEPQLVKQNQDLKSEYNIAGFPTIVLLAPDLHEIAITGYRKDTGERYAEYLSELVSDYNTLTATMQNVQEKNLSTVELEMLYKKAVKIGRDDYATEILDIGLEKQDNLFFLGEQYRVLVEAGKIHQEETNKLRDELLRTDISNTAGMHYYVAVIDFQYLMQHESASTTALELVEPLTSYLREFGNEDQAHAWRIQMTIAQIYLSKDQARIALGFAKSALQNAPPEFRSEIESVVTEIQNVMK